MGNRLALTGQFDLGANSGAEITNIFMGHVGTHHHA
jgi:hypothetical protein